MYIQSVSLIPIKHRDAQRKFQSHLNDYDSKVAVIWLVVYLPFWKMMEFVSWADEIPNIWKNNPNVPNHQLVIVVSPTFSSRARLYPSQWAGWPSGAASGGTWPTSLILQKPWLSMMSLSNCGLFEIFEATYCNQSFLNLHVGIFVIATTDLGTAFFNGEVRSSDVWHKLWSQLVNIVFVHLHLGKFIVNPISGRWKPTRPFWGLKYQMLWITLLRSVLSIVNHRWPVARPLEASGQDVSEVLTAKKVCFNGSCIDIMLGKMWLVEFHVRRAVEGLTVHQWFTVRKLERQLSRAVETLWEDAKIQIVQNLPPSITQIQESVPLRREEKKDLRANGIWPRALSEELSNAVDLHSRYSSDIRCRCAGSSSVSQGPNWSRSWCIFWRIGKSSQIFRPIFSV